MDPITDMLNRIRNAQAVGKASVSLPFSEMKYNIAKILQAHNFVGEVDKKGRKVGKSLDINLKYQKSDSGVLLPAISGIKRISKQGQRIYKKSRDVKKVRGGYGISIISTPKGIMADREARKQKLGGEVICEVW